MDFVSKINSNLIKSTVLFQMYFSDISVVYITGEDINFRLEGQLDSFLFIRWLL